MYKRNTSLFKVIPFQSRFWFNWTEQGHKMNPQRIILKFNILKRLNTSNTHQKRGCVVICTSRHRKQKIGNDIHPRSLTSQFAPEKWMESCFPFWIRCFIRLSGASCYKLRGSSGSVHKVDSCFISSKNWGKKTMPNFTGREKLSNKNKVSLSIQVASLQLEFAIQYRWWCHHHWWFVVPEVSGWKEC